MIKLLPIIGLTETWGEQTRFYFWKYLVMSWRNFTHFNLQAFILDFTWNCCKVQEAKKFQGTQVNLSLLLEKSDNTNPSPNS